MAESWQSELHATLAAINRAWREKRPADMEPHLHPEVTMVLPRFTGTVTGKDALIASFVEFCANAKVHEYEESDEQIQIVGDVAFVNYRFTMVYELPTYRARSSGRDVWAFKRTEERWLAVWRLMTDVSEERLEP